MNINEILKGEFNLKNEQIENVIKLIDEGKEAILYEEGMSHPADMAWNACLKEDEYNDFIKKVDETGLDIDKILLEMIKEWID